MSYPLVLETCPEFAIVLRLLSEVILMRAGKLLRSFAPITWAGSKAIRFLYLYKQIAGCEIASKVKKKSKIARNKDLLALMNPQVTKRFARQETGMYSN